MKRHTTSGDTKGDGVRAERHRAPLTGRVARYAAGNPKRVLAAWGVLLAATVGVIMLLLGSGLTTDVKYRASTPDSVAGIRLIENRMTGPTKATEIVIVRSETLKVADAGFRAYVGDLATRIQGLGPKMVAGTRTYYQTKDPTQLSKDGHATLIAVTLADEPGKAADYVDKLHALLVSSQSGGFTIQQTGDASMGKAAMQLSASDLGRAEIFGMPAAMFILLIVFGAVVAAGMPNEIVSRTRLIHHFADHHRREAHRRCQGQRGELCQHQARPEGHGAFSRRVREVGLPDTAQRPARQPQTRLPHRPIRIPPSLCKSASLCTAGKERNSTR